MATLEQASGLRLGAPAVVLLAAALRLPTLALQSLWLDEAYTARLVHMNLGGMVHTIPQTESTPPLYYLLTWAFTHVFGYGEYSLRFVSALAGTAAVLVIYLTADRIAGRRAALIAGGLAAVSPALVWFSQEARAYSLATLLSALTVLCLVRFLERRDWRWLAGWALAAGLGMATHYFVAFVVAPELLWLVRAARPDRRVLLAGAAVMIAAGALVPLALTQRGTGHADYISRGSLAIRVLQVPKQLVLGYASPGQVVTGAVAAGLVLIGLARLPLSRLRMPVSVGLAAIAVPVGLALAGADFLNTRNLLPALPPLLVALACGFATHRGGLRAAGALALISLLVVVLVDTDSRFQRDDWRGVSRALGPATGARVIVVTPSSGYIPLEVYRSAVRFLYRSVPVTELDVIAVPPNTSGSGISKPARLRGPAAVPAGFRLVETDDASTFTVLRFRASTPVPVSYRTAHRAQLVPGAVAVLIERASGP